jgi:hypothetical protein
LLVESGLAWAELTAVMLPVAATVVESEVEKERALVAFGAKYADFTPVASAMPDAARRRYADEIVLRLEASDSPLSWNNKKIRR